MSKQSLTIGIDIGSVALGAVILDESGNIIKSFYTFHKGRIISSIEEVLKDVQLADIGRIGLASPPPSLFKTGHITDSRVAFISAAKHLYPGMDALLIVGAEKFGLATFDENGEYLSYKSNTSCAAGTGNFLDQQAGRLNLGSIEEFSRIAWNNRGSYPLIASRCAVFAKTDLIHAQQEGWSLEAICDGLSYGLAKNICDTVFQSGSFLSVIVSGGVALNMAVMEHIRKLTGFEVIVDQYAHLYGAIGAALRAQEEAAISEMPFLFIDDIVNKEDKHISPYYPPLKLELSSYPDFSSLERTEFRSERFPNMTIVETDLYLNVNGETPVYLGIDIGSTSTKAILLSEQKDVIAGFYTRTSGQPLQAVQLIFECIRDLEKRHAVSFSVLGSATTGSGRKFIGKIVGADLIPDEITAHALAAYELDPETDTIIEIGGQDSKFTLMHNGMVTFSVMNNVCAAGTGSFIEEQARRLGCPLKEYSQRAENAVAPLASDRCTVFMERDLNNFLNSGYAVEEILAGVLHATRENYLSKVVSTSHIGKKIFFQGATAKNRALVAAFEQKLQRPIMVSPYCHLTGAMGAALELADKKIHTQQFRGLDLYKMKVAIRSEVCELCNNHCKLKVAEIGNETEAYGFLCGRDYHIQKFVRTQASFSLMGKRKEVFRFKSQAGETNPVIGIPAGLHLFEELPFWQKFFDQLGIKTITSENYSDAIKIGKKLSGAEFCAPLAAMYGHVDFLLERTDFVFLPIYLGDSSEGKFHKQYCYYTQYASPVISVQKQFSQERILTPLLRSSRGGMYARVELLKMFKKMGLTEMTAGKVNRAYKDSKLYQESLQKRWSDLYKQQISDEKTDIHVVLLGRPYTVLSPAMNSHIPDIFEKNGISTFFMDMLESENQAVSETEALVSAIKWKFASRILHAAGIIARKPGSYPVLITSFKCTPDSFVIEYFREIMQMHGKPYLILQLDEHDSSVGYETRIESGIRAFRNHFEKHQPHEIIHQESPKITSNEESAVTGHWEGYLRSLVKDARRILKGSPADFEAFSENLQRIEAPGNDFNYNMVRKAAGLKGKTLLLPNWDPVVGPLLEAVLVHSGVDARLLDSSPESMQRSLTHNTGQCLPLNMILQDSIDYIKTHNLSPGNTVVWSIESNLSCNFSMFPYFMKKLLNDQGNGLEEVGMYLGDIVFYDISLQTAITAFLAYSFGGHIRKLGCKIRPYEKEKGQTDRVIVDSLRKLNDMFRYGTEKESCLQAIVKEFEAIPVNKVDKPKAAIFGDLYVRDNDMMNQDLIRVIEENGGEVITTSYSEYMKIVAEPFMERTYKEGRYLEYVKLLFLKTLIPVIEERYSRFFYPLIGYPMSNSESNIEEWISHFGLNLLHKGESFENILKIHHLITQHPKPDMLVQTNPSYCCPALITEAMANRIEEMTGIPVVTIEYDGTTASKNEVLIPYLKYRRKKTKHPAGH